MFIILHYGFLSLLKKAYTLVNFHKGTGLCVWRAEVSGQHPALQKSPRTPSWAQPSALRIVCCLALHNRQLPFPAFLLYMPGVCRMYFYGHLPRCLFHCEIHCAGACAMNSFHHCAILLNDYMTVYSFYY